jgi:AraC family ethanolamine operon transcriptional activator
MTDFEQLGEVFANWHGQIEQISSGCFRGSVQVVCGGLVRIVGVHSNQKVRVRGNDTSGLVSVYPVTTDFDTSLWQGRRFEPGRLLVQGSQAEGDLTFSRGFVANLLMLQPDPLEDAIRTLLGGSDTSSTQTWMAYSPSTESFEGLTTQIKQRLELGMIDPSALASAEGRQAEQECVRALVAALHVPTALPSNLPMTARSRVLGSAEELMRSHLRNPIGAIDVCRSLGVSDRTLRLAFREKYGLGPMTYYKFLRLNAVRSTLKSAPPDSIAIVARDYGFHHLGNFAADYRRLFGALPSER